MKKTAGLILAVCLFSVQFLWAQTKTIVGKVTDGSGTPLANASITVKGSRSGTASGADGTFSLTVPDNVKMLTVSAVGYETLDVAISGSFVSVAPVSYSHLDVYKRQAQYRLFCSIFRQNPSLFRQYLDVRPLSGNEWPVPING